MRLNSTTASVPRPTQRRHHVPVRRRRRLPPSDAASGVAGRGSASEACILYSRRCRATVIPTKPLALFMKRTICRMCSRNSMPPSSTGGGTHRRVHELRLVASTHMVIVPHGAVSRRSPHQTGLPRRARGGQIQSEFGDANHGGRVERAVRVSEDKHEQTDTRGLAPAYRKSAPMGTYYWAGRGAQSRQLVESGKCTDLGDYIEGHATNRSRARALILA